MLLEVTTTNTISERRQKERSGREDVRKSSSQPLKFCRWMAPLVRKESIWILRYSFTRRSILDPYCQSPHWTPERKLELSRKQKARQLKFRTIVLQHN